MRMADYRSRQVSGVGCAGSAGLQARFRAAMNSSIYVASSGKRGAEAPHYPTGCTSSGTFPARAT